MTLSFYNKPKKDNKTKVLIQGKNKDMICEFVFETMPKIYRRVMAMGKNEIEKQRKEIACDNCEYKSKDIPLLREHIDVEHILPYRKKIQQKIISAYKCDECNFAVPTRSGLRTHVNSIHKKKKQLIHAVPLSKVNIEHSSLNVSTKKEKEVCIYDCQICDAVLISEQLLTKHMECHTETQDTVSQVIEDVLCRVCDKLFDRVCGIEEHMSAQHPSDEINPKVELKARLPGTVEVESLFSCNQCDFDTDKSDNLIKHYKKSIHDVLNLNKTLDEANSTQKEEQKASTTRKEERENVKYSCYLCQYETRNSREMDDHGASEHGIINCDKCEYRAEDFDIMKKHKLKHTGRILFTCNICEFESSKQSMLAEHKESKHSNPKEMEMASYECDRCEKQFKHAFLLKNHTCIPAFKYPCQVCTFVAISVIELLEHMNGVHSKKSIPSKNPECVTCPFCKLKAKNLDELKTHFEHIHTKKNEQDDIQIRESLNCPKCSFKGPKSELEKHVKSKHEKHHVCEECGIIFVDKDDLRVHIQDEHKKAPCPEPFPCEKCGLVLANFNHLQDHVNNHHPSGEVNCQYCDFCGGSEEILQSHMLESHTDVVILHTMAKQVEDFKDLADGFTKFEHFKSELSNALKSLFDNQNKLQQELFLIRNSLSISSSKAPELKETTSAPPSGSASHAKPQWSPKPSSTSSPVQLNPRPSSSTSTPSRPSSKGGPATRPTTRPPPPPAKAARRVSTPLKTECPSKILYIGDSISANVNIKSLEVATQSQLVTAKAYSSVNDTVSNIAKQAPKFPASNFADVIPKQLNKENFKCLVIQAGSVDITNLKTKHNPSQNMEYFRQETIKSATNLFNAGVKALKVQPNLTKVVIMKQIPRYDPLDVDPLSLKPSLSLLYNNTMTNLWMESPYKEKIYIGNHNIECNGAIRESRYRHTKSGRYDGIHLYGSSGTKAYTLSVLNILKAANVTSSEHDFHQSCAQFKYQNRQIRGNSWQSVKSNDRKFKGRQKQLPTSGPVPTYSRFNGLNDMDQGNW